MGSAGEEIAKMNSLVSIAGDQEVSMDKRLAAVKKLQDEYPSYFGNLDKERILNGDVATATDGVKTAIIERAKATAIASKINKLSAEKFAKDEELYQLALQKTAKVQAAIEFVKKNPSQAKYLTGLITGQVSGIRDQENAIKLFVDNIDKELNRLSGLYTKSAKESIELDGGKGGKTSTPTLQDPNIKLLEAKKQYYKDDLLMSASFEQEILARQRDLAVRQAELEGKSGKNIQTIKDTYNQLILNSQAETGRKILEEQSKLGVEQAKEYDKELKEEEKRNKERIARGQKAYEDSLKTVSEFYKNKMNLATGDKNQQIAILREEQAYFDILYGFNLISYEDYVKKTGEITKQQIGLNNALVKSSAQATLQLGMAIMSALAPAFDMMVEKGASIGEALESVFTNLLKQLAKVIVTAAIAVALMAALGLVDFAAIGSTFKMLVSQGMGLPKMGAGAGGGVSQPLTMFDGFANGGIISGPTYGLMGEYPGAQNNPEVVAPLDKLKDMMGGGGGGTFMLRGQDLLLSVNRAQKASNLKGQNISLA
jgi:hypothetical protein